MAVHVYNFNIMKRRGFLGYALILGLCVYALFVFRLMYMYSNHQLTDAPTSINDETSMTINYDRNVEHFEITETGNQIPYKTSDISPDTMQIQKTDCPSVTFPNEEAFETRWWPVTDDKQAYVYSAYIDGKNVRIVGAVANTKNKLYCQLWFKHENGYVSMATAPATISLIPESRKLKYSATYYLCPRPDLELPFAVSLVATDACRQPSHALRIHPTNQKPVNFSVCVKPFVYNYSRAYELVEWIELNIALGVNHFTFYNHSSRSNIKHVLDYYSKRGLVDVLPFHIPVKISTWPPSTGVELHAFGHLVASNDCLFRHVGKTDYLSIHDVDEFIVPRHKDDVTWTDMLKRLPDSSQYIFRNCFFRKEWEDSYNDGNSTANGLIRKYRIVTQSKLQREMKIWPAGSRSKLIVKPNDIEAMGIHTVWKKKRGRSYTVDPDVGMLHHYRDWENEDDKQAHIDDDTMVKFQVKLLRRIQTTWDNLPGVAIDIPNDY